MITMTMEPTERTAGAHGTDRLDASDVREVERARAEIARSRLLVVFHRAGVALRVLKPGAPVVVGRGGDDPIPDKTLSEAHARFEMVGDEVVVEDLRSLNGTWIEDTRVSRQALGRHVEVRLGAVVVHLHGLAGAPLDAQLEPRIAAAAASWRLSPRLCEVLELIALGKTNKEISRDLGCEEGTVEAHLTKLFQKSGAENRTDLASRLWRI